MDSFRPTPPSWSKKFWNNPTAPLGLTLAVAIGSFWYIRHQFRMADAPVSGNGRYVRMKSADAPHPAGATPIAAGEVAPPPAGDAAIADAAPTSPTMMATADSMVASTARGLAAGTPSGDSAADSSLDSAAEEVTARGSYPLRFTFVEVPKALMERLLEEQKKAGPNGLEPAQLQKLWEAVGKIPDAELYSVSYPFQANRLAMKRNLSGEGQGVDSGEAGLRLDADVSMRAPASAPAGGAGPTLLAGTLQLNAHLRLEEKGNLHSKEKALSGNFSFKPGNAWIYHVDLPRGPLGDTGLVPSGVHRVFLSEGFQKHETEVTLVVELDKQSEY